MDDPFDVAGYVRRVRRLADLSQRELAALLGVSRAAVGRMETGEAGVDAETLSQMLGLAGLRLCVVDESGDAVPPVPRDVLRDHAGRHFPSHLDVLPPHDLPTHRGANPGKASPRQRAGTPCGAVASSSAIGAARRSTTPPSVVSVDGWRTEAPSCASGPVTGGEAARSRSAPAPMRASWSCACPAARVSANLTAGVPANAVSMSAPQPVETSWAEAA